ncbi:hypothetical protein NHF46_03115 [Arthrobacter alpinus]|nr:hypothetical protein [Arthrobacter alpinus]
MVSSFSGSESIPGSRSEAAADSPVESESKFEPVAGAESGALSSGQPGQSGPPAAVRASGASPAAELKWQQRLSKALRSLG